ncbi:hypothetical protein [Clostridium sp. SM-530-WT-3G]|uniref:hypothetical protein n=1 Tax=Clostridium sp. SM-530-WT-3G TaxID=2725303 RepID=UPI00145D1BD8|nr:hypothetical protein [Clostridium sp. SM-530-WT-3G]NME82857.1 hypothetical protein [Clostridium sp. SM-530-WT-3G]
MHRIIVVDVNKVNKVAGILSKLIPAAKNIKNVHKDRGMDIYIDSFISIHLELLKSIIFGVKKYFLYLENVS